jgi:hypothetical protein
MMIEFVQKQLEASERLFEMMRDDHNLRMKEIEIWAEATQNLMKKLEQRDELIRNLIDNNKHLREQNDRLCLDLGLRDYKI